MKFHRVDYLEDYRRRLAAARVSRLPACGEHVRPQLQRVFEAGVSAGLDPKSLDFTQDNPHERGTHERSAWLSGWLTGAETFCR